MDMFYSKPLRLTTPYPIKHSSDAIEFNFQQKTFNTTDKPTVGCLIEISIIKT